jgi:hypothetical protein
MIEFYSLTSSASLLSSSLLSLSILILFQHINKTKNMTGNSPTPSSSAAAAAAAHDYTQKGPDVLAMYTLLLFSIGICGYVFFLGTVAVRLWVYGGTLGPKISGG